MNVHVKKTVPIEYLHVAKAYQKVRKGGKAVGIDEESWTDFEKDVEGNLYVLWNRLASGSYHPQAVREVEIPKKDGSKRKLGIPTLRDRIAQQVVKDYMEKRIDKLFHENSYGYRPLKSAHQAVEQIRQNCFKQDWVIDMDISKFFDEISHELMLKAVGHVMEEKWVKMYVERWLQMPIQKEDGTLHEKAGKGTPQGGVISPILANLYLHFTFDLWLSKNYPGVKFVRYADDIVIHCSTKEQAEEILDAVKRRLAETKLQIKEEKTRIAYCKDYKRKLKNENVKFDFMGFSFQPRETRGKVGNKPYIVFVPEINKDNQNKIREAIREDKIWRDPLAEISDIADRFNPKLRGWLNYYGKFGNRTLRRCIQNLDLRITRWICKKYKILTRKAMLKLKGYKQTRPGMFAHWKKGYC